MDMSHALSVTALCMQKRYHYLPWVALRAVTSSTLRVSINGLNKVANTNVLFVNNHFSKDKYIFHFVESCTIN